MVLRFSCYSILLKASTLHQLRRLLRLRCLHQNPVQDFPYLTLGQFIPEIHKDGRFVGGQVLLADAVERVGAGHRRSLGQAIALDELAAGELTRCIAGGVTVADHIQPAHCYVCRRDAGGVEGGDYVVFSFLTLSE